MTKYKDARKKYKRLQRNDQIEENQKSRGEKSKNISEKLVLKREKETASGGGLQLRKRKVSSKIKNKEKINNLWFCGVAITGNLRD